MHILEKDILEVMEEACDLFISEVRLVIFISEVHRLVISSYWRFVGF
jgi:replication-associated recombination protein RarA